MSVVGILGGGQLARMLALAGAPLGARFRILDSASDACAGEVAPLLHADFTDTAALGRFAAQVDVATFDFENVPAASAEWLAARLPVFPAPAALAITQDRMAEKQVFTALGIGTPAFAAVGSRAELEAAVDRIGLPAILKTRRLGYDGKGQFRLCTRADVDAAWHLLGNSLPGVTSLILEAFVPFDHEISVIAVRARDGEFRTWPLTRNWHADGILSVSLAPWSIGSLDTQAVGHARAIAEHLDYVGVFALELFVCGGTLLANEMAPRVHNSGHWTIEGAICSQFENHVRAVLELPLGDPSARGPAAMLNWVGEMPDGRVALSASDVHWHDYGKTPRPGRKLGHATICASSRSELAVSIEDLARRLDRADQCAPLLAALRQGDL
ncbi:MAG: 5-(carboxyamino)imidazole ribonucleotide synthase [Lysobacterales bacterium]